MRFTNGRGSVFEAANFHLVQEFLLHLEQLFFFRCLERIAGLKMHVDSVNKAAQKISYAAEEEYNLVLNCSGDPSNDL